MRGVGGQRKRGPRCWSAVVFEFCNSRQSPREPAQARAAVVCSLPSLLSSALLFLHAYAHLLCHTLTHTADTSQRSTLHALDAQPPPQQHPRALLHASAQVDPSLAQRPTWLLLSAPPRRVHAYLPAWLACLRRVRCSLAHSTAYVQGTSTCAACWSIFEAAFPSFFDIIDSRRLAAAALLAS